MEAYLNEQEIRRAIAALKEPGELFEIRIIRSNRKQPVVGYFKDVDKMLRELHKQDMDKANVYMVLNVINPACYGKDASDRFTASSSTSDNDITERRYVLVDLDPVRPSGVSSTQEQLKYAWDKMKSVGTFLMNQGFAKPMVGFSGNGYHLIYKVAMKNDNANRDLIQSFLQTLDALFSDENVKIDVANFNASRVCKLYGTMAQKGSSTDKQPHRMSKVASVPEPFAKTEKAYFQKVIDIIPKETEKPQQYNRYNGQQFDVEEWMDKHGIGYRKASISDGTKYILDHCPFDESHTGKDAAVIRRNNGALCFHCFHNSCADKGWKDLRLLYEPNAYERKWQEHEKRMYGHFNRERPLPKPLEEKKDEPIWYTPMDIWNMPQEQVEYIKTGFDGIDRRTYGLQKRAISVVTGLRSAGKSTWIDDLILNAIQSGNRVGCFSGELPERQFMRWLIRQAAGKGRVEPGRFEGQWNVPRKYQESIVKWLQGKFYLYNNDYGNNFVQMLEAIQKKIESDKLDLVILDNLMALNIEDLSDNQWNAQTEFVLKLSVLAKKMNVHILFVAHPRKTVDFLRLEDISGVGNLANAVDEAFLIHRNNEDFRRRSAAMFHWKEDNPAYDGTNVIEIAKDRENGTQDVFVPLYYEKETKRLKNDPTENIIYGWDTDDGFVPVDEPVFD